MEVLQLGRGFSAAESFLLYFFYYFQICFNWAAAFQPRKVGSQLIPSSTYRASIGPRLFSRGKYGIPAGTFRLRPLQLGRGFSAAERMTAGKCGRTMRELQLGRGFSAAESVCGMGRHGTPGGFNWAAAFQPRKEQTTQTIRKRSNRRYDHSSGVEQVENSQ